MSDYTNETGLPDGAGDRAYDDAAAARTVAERARAKADKVIGRVEDVVGRTLGEPAARVVRERADGVVDRAEGLYDAGRYRLDRELAEQPYKTLAITALAGLVVGFMLARR